MSLLLCHPLFQLHTTSSLALSLPPRTFVLNLTTFAVCAMRKPCAAHARNGHINTHRVNGVVMIGLVALVVLVAIVMTMLVVLMRVF